MYKFIHICSYNYMIADSLVIAIDSIFSTKNVYCIDKMLSLKTKNAYSVMMFFFLKPKMSILYIYIECFFSTQNVNSIDSIDKMLFLKKI